MPKPRWKLDKFVTVRFKLLPETLKRYKALMISKGRTMQQDFEEHVINSLK